MAMGVVHKRGIPSDMSMGGRASELRWSANDEERCVEHRVLMRTSVRSAVRGCAERVRRSR